MSHVALGWRFFLTAEQRELQQLQKEMETSALRLRKQGRGAPGYFDPAGCPNLTVPVDSYLHTTPQGVSLYLYTGEDIVSEYVRLGGWERVELAELMQVLAEPEVKTHTPPIFVDIGANVGWFSMNVASHGYKVYAFEGMPQNVELMKATVCASEEGRGNVLLYPYGLGTSIRTCMVISDKSNQGDGFTLCGKDVTEQRSRFSGDYSIRGTMEMRRLDEIMDMDVRVMKIDVEGYEPWVIAGAMKWLTQRKVMYILTEVSYFSQVHMSGGHPPTTYYYMLRGLGYRCSTKGFEGEDVDPDVIARMRVGSALNLFCKKTWFPLDE